MEEFKRTVFVKDLYTSKGLLNKFYNVEFEDLQTLVSAVGNEIFLFSSQENSIVRVNIKELNEFETIRQIVESAIDVKNILFDLYVDFASFDDQKALKAELDKFTSNIRVTAPHNYKFDWIQEQVDPKGWFARIPLYIDTILTYENYAESLNSIPIINKDTRVRFFNISIDFKSFESATMEDVHRIRYFLNQTSELIRQRTIIVESRDFFARSVYVDKNFKLYISKKAKANKSMLFNLNKFFDDDGESIKFRPLNDLLAYLDLPLYDIGLNKNLNWALIDMYQNLEVNESYSRIPFMAPLFMEALV